MTVPGSIDVPDDDRDTYHIVCHDCPTEFLTTARSEAEQRLSEHQSTTGHDVEFAALGGVTVESE